MYGKIFDSIYDGTLAEDWRALITFQQLIVLCDADGIVDMTPAAISRRTGIPIEHIKAGLEILERPDPYSRTSAEGGCRIKLMDDHRPWGWYIVNHSKYKAYQDSDTVRAQNRERKRRQRERQKGAGDSHAPSRDVTDCHTESRHTDTNTSLSGGRAVIPENWQPSTASIEHAKIHKLPHSDLTVQKFKDLFAEQGRLTADPDASYRKFLANERAFTKPGGTHGRTSRPTRFESTAAALRKFEQDALDEMDADPEGEGGEGLASHG